MIKKKNFSYLFVINFLILTVLLIVLLTSLGSRSNFKAIQVEQLRIVSKNSDAEINLGFSNSTPLISILNENKETIFEISGKDKATLTIFEKNNPIASIYAATDGGAEICLNDEKTVQRVKLSSSKLPGLFLKNETDKTVGSFTVVADGGGGFGLADASGSASALLRGGSSPSLAFFSNQEQPLAAFGILNETPHMLISGPIGEEGILIHGGRPNSMLVVDENGKVKILISKHGVFQGKKENDLEVRKKDKKIFSFDDKNRLFPSIQESKR
jgi:hypothetical protein